MKFKIFYPIFLVLLIASCSSDHSQKLDVDTSKVNIGNFEIRRYEQDLFKINTDEIELGLRAIQEKYFVFLGADLSDSSNLKQIKDFISDKELVEAYHKIETSFPNLNSFNSELEKALIYYKYHFPQKPNFSIYTYISGFQYEYPIQIADSTMIIGLDLYLGKDFKTYQQMGIPAYKIDRMQAPNISIDCMKEIALQLVIPPPPSPSFLDQIIYRGKIMYFLDATLPNKAAHLKIGYKPEQLNWCIENEGNLWAFIIDNQILFNSDYEIIRKFITDGPFTAAFSKESPARIGVWFGWQIVKSYMNNNPEVSIAALFKNSDSKNIFSRSKYKP